jgi:hypothetical protein
MGGSAHFFAYHYSGTALAWTSPAGLFAYTTVANITGRTALAFKLRAGTGANLLLSDSTNAEPYEIALFGDYVTITRGVAGASAPGNSTAVPGLVSGAEDREYYVAWASGGRITVGMVWIWAGALDEATSVFPRLELWIGGVVLYAFGGN